MPTQHAYDYAVLRLVPNAERAEFVNVGVVLQCAELAFLDSQVFLNEAKIRVLWPELDLEVVRYHVDAFPKVCAGNPDAGPIALLPRRARFQWLVAPRSTMIQVSEVHSGMCEDPRQTLEALTKRLVE